MCDEEGKLKECEPNRVLEDENGRPYDIVVGNFLIMGLSEEEMDLDSLPDELVEKYREKFRWPETFYRKGNYLFVRTEQPGASPRLICEM